jgi:hypothetical protein
MKRIAALEAMSDQGAGLDEIHVLFVEPTPDGPRYTGEVHVIPLDGGERRWETRAELVGQVADGKPQRMEAEADLNVIIHKPEASHEA